MAPDWNMPVRAHVVSGMPQIFGPPKTLLPLHRIPFGQRFRQSIVSLIVLGCLLGGAVAARAIGPPQDGSGEPAGSDEPLPVRLTYIPTGMTRTVAVAGTFNRWNKTSTPLAPQPSGLQWTVTLRLEPGVYRYRYVINGSHWMTPRDAPRVSDGNGSINGLLIVAPPDFADHPAKLGDGRITASGVLHRVTVSAPEPTGATIRNATRTDAIAEPRSDRDGLHPGATIRNVTRTDAGHIELRLRTRHDDVEDCWLLTPGENARPSRTKMTRNYSDRLFDYWSGVAAVKAGMRTLRYAFLLRDGGRERIYDSAESLWAPTHTLQWFQLIPMDYPTFETPDWAREAIFYQIFPDRFADGDTKNDPPDVVQWGSPPTTSNRMGGDLAGILNRLEYLRDLGINALYLNPIFESRSNHGYDTTDYMRIDPRFGTSATLKSLTARAHLHGWHVILDGVFNHTGVDFEPFQSVVREGASSPYRNWYFVHRFPVRVRDGRNSYEGWNGSPWMPKLNVRDPAARDYLLNAAAHWTKEAKIDGWRLDAASEVSHDFWKTFRKTIKSIKPDALIIGEVWTDAREWLQGDEMDSVTNYRWRGATLDFFAFDKSSPSGFDAQLAQIRAEYPVPATSVMFNMLGSHDVERIRTLCQGDWLKERQAVAFQMTYPGTPCIYYGDEIGLEGGKDPDNRRAMPWDKRQWDETSHKFYKECIALRKKHAVLRRGDYQTLVADVSGVYAFLRSYNDERALVVFNRSDAPQTATVPISRAGFLPYQTWLDGGSKTERQGDNLVISLPKRGFAILGH